MPFCNIFPVCMRLGEICHYCFIGYLCTSSVSQNSLSIAASLLGAQYRHPSHILILWRHDIAICKDSVVLAGTVYLAMLFSSGFHSHKRLLLSWLIYSAITFLLCPSGQLLSTKLLKRPHFGSDTMPPSSLRCSHEALLPP